ncbi:DNA/RNA nuclease SfsA [Geomicrobium sp. JCM 19038]|uniref:DNA/RNA nuclease SfsA n=1 Tax=Geomicrobium sp. JCM 19038 TaxID=1460635 RepID=UPI00045F4ADC|nr:DNA/RNA nuclease SfsA [Geomicrobium sp. JCM 19038]GAK09236.1 sugar/maltose fermentation stimulation protein homolog [Geomicrobium sp. JCM 19038]
MLQPMKGKLERAIFVERPNRFIIMARRSNGEHVRVHLPDPGRLQGILEPGRELFLRFHDNPNRKTNWSAVLAEREDQRGFVALETTNANALAKLAIENHRIPSLEPWSIVRQEYTYGDSRWDFLLENGKEQALLEVKSVTYGIDGTGYFPDAVTKRGTKHVQELHRIAKSTNYKSIVLFIAQRDDLSCIRPAEHIDSQFAKALTEAHENVTIIGLKTRPTIDGYEVLDELPVLFS